MDLLESARLGVGRLAVTRLLCKLEEELRTGVARSLPTGAGSYVIRATVGGHNVPGWPQSLHIEAGLSDAAQCWLTGPPLKVASPAVVFVKSSLCSCALRQCLSL